MSQPRNTDEFLELYAGVQSPLFRYICAMVVDPNDARDILQETNLALWMNFEQFEPGTNFLAWARTIARYRVLQFRRLHRRSPVLIDEAILESVAADILEEPKEIGAARKSALQKCLEKLSMRDRELLQLRYASDQGLDEAAKLLSRTVNAISQSLRRIRETLRECIQRNESISKEA